MPTWVRSIFVAPLGRMDDGVKYLLLGIVIAALFFVFFMPYLITAGGSSLPVASSTVLTGRTEVARTHPAFSTNPQALPEAAAVQVLRAAYGSEVR